jgi:hypothetical protein
MSEWKKNAVTLLIAILVFFAKKLWAFPELSSKFVLRFHLCKSAYSHTLAFVPFEIGNNVTLVIMCLKGKAKMLKVIINVWIEPCGLIMPFFLNRTVLFNLVDMKLQNFDYRNVFLVIFVPDWRRETLTACHDWKIL